VHQESGYFVNNSGAITCQIGLHQSSFIYYFACSGTVANCR